MADAEGRSADALSFMQAAADLEKSIDTHDTLSPGPVGATAHELLGELLLKTGRAREALASFEESLKLAKHRARSYFGAAKAANLAGDADRHKAHVAKLAEVCGVSAANDACTGSERCAAFDPALRLAHALALLAWLRFISCTRHPGLDGETFCRKRLAMLLGWAVECARRIRRDCACCLDTGRARRRRLACRFQSAHPARHSRSPIAISRACRRRFSSASLSARTSARAR